jgi:hypothetical protein
VCVVCKLFNLPAAGFLIPSVFKKCPETVVASLSPLINIADSPSILDLDDETYNLLVTS